MIQLLTAADCWSVDAEYDIPLPGLCQGIDNFTLTVRAFDKLSNVVMELA